VETRSVGTTTIAGILPPVKRLLPDTIVASPIVADPIVTDPIVADTEI
jgi:hypothetical protein